MGTDNEEMEEARPIDKRTYTIDEIQDIMRISRPTAYRLAASGEFKVIRIGGRYRISKRSFDAWLEEQL